MNQEQQTAEQILSKHIAYDCSFSEIEEWKKLHPNLFESCVKAMEEYRLSAPKEVITKERLKFLVGEWWDFADKNSDVEVAVNEIYKLVQNAAPKEEQREAVEIIKDLVTLLDEAYVNMKNRYGLTSSHEKRVLDGIKRATDYYHKPTAAKEEQPKTEEPNDEGFISVRARIMQIKKAAKYNKSQWHKGVAFCCDEILKFLPAPPNNEQKPELSVATKMLHEQQPTTKNNSGEEEQPQEKLSPILETHDKKEENLYRVVDARKRLPEIGGHYFVLLGRLKDKCLWSRTGLIKHVEGSNASGALHDVFWIEEYTPNSEPKD